jgi:hypothetical protein
MNNLPEKRREIRMERDRKEKGERGRGRRKRRRSIPRMNDLPTCVVPMKETTVDGRKSFFSSSGKSFLKRSYSAVAQTLNVELAPRSITGGKKWANLHGKTLARWERETERQRV